MGLVFLCAICLVRGDMCLGLENFLFLVLDSEHVILQSVLVEVIHLHFDPVEGDVICKQLAERANLAI